MTTGAPIVADGALWLKRYSEESIPNLVLIQRLGSIAVKASGLAMRRVSLVVRAEIDCKTVCDLRRQADEAASPVVGVGRARDKPRVDHSLDQSLRAARR